MHLTVEWEHGGETHRQTLEGERPYLIGRLPKCDIVIDDNTVSRQQAVIKPEGLIYSIRNLSQSNPIIRDDGTVLETGQSAGIKPDSRFRMGHVELRVVELETPLTQFKVKCPGCERIVKANLTDCPWCGASLAGGGTAVIIPD